MKMIGYFFPLTPQIQGFSNFEFASSRTYVRQIGTQITDWLNAISIALTSTIRSE